MRTVLREFLKIFILAIAIFFLLQTTIQTSVVVGISMEPSVHQGQRLIVNKVVYRFYQPERGDVIVLHPPNNQGEDHIKRIIAIPGDTVEVKMGEVYVNGLQLDEPYIKDSPKYTFHQIKMPENEYFVLGDNRNNSSDSHNVGTLPRQNIVGKAWLSIWPPDEWGLAPNYPIEEQLASSTHE